MHQKIFAMGGPIINDVNTHFTGTLSFKIQLGEDSAGRHRRRRRRGRRLALRRACATGAPAVGVPAEWHRLEQWQHRQVKLNQGHVRMPIPTAAWGKAGRYRGLACGRRLRIPAARCARPLRFQAIGTGPRPHRLASARGRPPQCAPPAPSCRGRRPPVGRIRAADGKSARPSGTARIPESAQQQCDTDKNRPPPPLSPPSRSGPAASLPWGRLARRRQGPGASKSRQGVRLSPLRP